MTTAAPLLQAGTLALAVGRARRFCSFGFVLIFPSGELKKWTTMRRQVLKTHFYP